MNNKESCNYFYINPQQRIAQKQENQNPIHKFSVFRIHTVIYLFLFSFALLVSCAIFCLSCASMNANAYKFSPINLAS